MRSPMEFYDRLEMMQGEQRTYYCGGLLAFELVEAGGALLSAPRRNAILTGTKRDPR